MAVWGVPDPDLGRGKQREWGVGHREEAEYGGKIGQTQGCGAPSTRG